MGLVLFEVGWFGLWVAEKLKVAEVVVEKE